MRKAQPSGWAFPFNLRFSLVILVFARHSGAARISVVAPLFLLAILAQPSRLGLSLLMMIFEPVKDFGELTPLEKVLYDLSTGDLGDPPPKTLIAER
jgi:hypothetical protein